MSTIEPIDWTARVEGLASLPTVIREQLRREGRLMHVTAGHTVFRPGSVPNQLLFLLGGTVRVFLSSDSGRDIVLYRVEAGQSCIMTTACVLAHEPYSAQGIAETDLVAVALPRASLDELTGVHPAFRDFVFATFSRRIVELFRLIDEVVFARIDARLAARMLALAGGASELKMTHQNLAMELGTAREVISRQLSEFQRRGWVDQQRGRVVLKDRVALSGLAEYAH